MKLSGRGAPSQVAIALVVVVAGLLIAACGSSSSNSSSTSTNAAATNSTSSSRAKLVACLKAHGVTLPAGAGQFRRRAPGAGGPPGGGGGGLFGGGGGSRAGGGAGGANRGRFFNSKTAAAFKACGAQFGGAGRFRGRGRFQLSHAKITQFVACVRKHGYNLPSPNFSGKGPVFPASIRTNKKFQTASRACASILAPPGATSTNAPA